MGPGAVVVPGALAAVRRQRQTTAALRRRLIGGPGLVSRARSRSRAPRPAPRRAAGCRRPQLSTMRPPAAAATAMPILKADMLMEMATGTELGARCAIWLAIAIACAHR